MRIDWSQLALPVMQAPMFIVSNPELVVASCRAGVIGAFPAGNPRAPETLESWLVVIRNAERESLDRGGRFAPFCVNLLASGTIDPAARARSLEVCRHARAPLILTNLGDPSVEVQAAHDWGGIVFHDVTTMRYAEKAIAAGVDGLMLVCGGAGGHAGTLNPFAFLPQVRRMFDGVILLAGGVADGAGVAAALALGADLVVMGTRFIATEESGASPEHKAMLVSVGSEDVLYTDAIAGLPASFLKPSMVEAGLDPQALPPPLGLHRADLPKGVRAWRDIWSGGHSVGLIQDAPSVAEVVRRLGDEMDQAATLQDWRARLQGRTG